MKMCDQSMLAVFRNLKKKVIFQAFWKYVIAGLQAKINVLSLINVKF